MIAIVVTVVTVLFIIHCCDSCWQDLKSTLAQELDFENEGRNGERCARELRSLSYIRVPVIFWHNTSKVASDFLLGLHT